MRSNIYISVNSAWQEPSCGRPKYILQTGSTKANEECNDTAMIETTRLKAVKWCMSRNLEICVFMKILGVQVSQGVQEMKNDSVVYMTVDYEMNIRD